MKFKLKPLVATVASVFALGVGTAYSAGESTRTGSQNQPSPQATTSQPGSGQMMNQQSVGQHGSTAGAQATMADARASKLIGMNVRNEQGEKLGDINDLAVDVQNNRIHYAIVGHGGVLGIGQKDVAVPVSRFKMNRTGDELVVNMNEQQMKDAPDIGRDRKNWDDAQRWSDVGRYYTQTLGMPAAEATTDQSFRRASDLIGKNVVDAQGERAGEIEDLVVNLADGSIHYAVMEYDRKWNPNDKLVALPMTSFQTAADRDELKIGMTREQLAQAPEFDQSQWPNLSDNRFRDSVLGFGRDGSTVGMDQRGTAGGTAATGTSGTTGATDRARPARPERRERRERPARWARPVRRVQPARPTRPAPRVRPARPARPERRARPGPRVRPARPTRPAPRVRPARPARPERRAGPGPRVRPARPTRPAPPVRRAQPTRQARQAHDEARQARLAQRVPPVRPTRPAPPGPPVQQAQRALPERASRARRFSPAISRHREPPARRAHRTGTAQQGQAIQPSDLPASGTAGTAGAPLIDDSEFSRLDTNRDGMLSREEARTNIQLNQQWEQLDTNKDGQLSREELRRSPTTGQGSSTAPGTERLGSRRGFDDRGPGLGHGRNAAEVTAVA
jgi:sporulation protein YlmC with PRC-barrel domain